MTDEAIKRNKSGKIMTGLHKGWYDAELADPPEDFVVLVIFEEYIALAYQHKKNWFAAPFPSEATFESPWALYWRFLPDPISSYEMGFVHPEDDDDSSRNDSCDDDSCEVAEPSTTSTLVN